MCENVVCEGKLVRSFQHHAWFKYGSIILISLGQMIHDSALFVEEFGKRDHGGVVIRSMEERWRSQC